MDNEILKILLDAMIKLVDAWGKGNQGNHCGMIADQVRFVKGLINDGLKK